MAFYRGEHVLRGGRPRPQDGGGPDGKREIEAVSEAVGEEQLGHAEAAVGLGDLEDPARVELGAEDHVVVQVDAALGQARAARGVEPEGGVVPPGGRRGELGRLGAHERGKGARPLGCLSHHHDLEEEGQLAPGNGQDLWEQAFADDGHARSRVVQEVKVVGGLEQGVHGNRYGADLDRAEEAVGELRDVGEEEQDPLFPANAEDPAQRVAHPVDAGQDFVVGHPGRAALDGDLPPATFRHVPIDEVGRGVERLGNVQVRRQERAITGWVHPA